MIVLAPGRVIQKTLRFLPLWQRFILLETDNQHEINYFVRKS
jgi:hypothetical protein